MTRAYHDLLFWVEQFFRTGEAPVAIEDTLEIMALLDTTERAARRGKAEAV